MPQSINVVKNFCELLVYMRDNLTVDEIPHCSRIHSAIIRTWKLWFKKLQKELTASLGTPSFMMDIWSSKNCTSYICLMVHYLMFWDIAKEENIILCSAITAFYPLTGNHSGKNICNTVKLLLMWAAITPSQLENSHWTVDNASNNTTFLNELKEDLQRQTPPVNFSTRNSHIFYFPHIINLVAQHIIKELNGGVEDDSDNEGSNGSSQVWTGCPERGSHGLGRQVHLIYADHLYGPYLIYRT
ncbi:hypothetical protein AX17_005918 [Amanita inopinata Kibby_2008]|nr:hypothetical protein AX17_005918 [Amanita inopinata Kibby_2008]